MRFGGAVSDFLLAGHTLTVIALPPGGWGPHRGSREGFDKPSESSQPQTLNTPTHRSRANPGL
jgi:hypothetical protein